MRLFLQLEGGDGQAVDEERQVKGTLLLVVAVPELSGDGEPVLGVALLSDGVPGRGGTVEQVNVVLAVVDALAQDVDDSSVANLAL